MSLYAVEKMPEVPRADMNATHQEEVTLVNEVGEAIEAVLDGADNIRLLELLRQWIEHTQAHFENEHRIMDETGFPAYSVHRGEHERVLDEIKKVVSDYQGSGDIAPLKTYLFETWPAWFDNHVNTMDFATAHFAQMAESGQKPF